jgi:signal transduction histidine kinase
VKTPSELASVPPDLTLAGLVHDLNNVFETILEAAELVSTDPQWKAVAATVQRSVERGQRIVGGYADQSRAGLDLDVVIDRAAMFLQDFLAHLPGVKIKVVRRLAAGLRVSGPATDWERVFMNLFLNAAQAMKEAGGGEIEVVAQAAGQVVEVTVSDSGPGIPEEILAKIFTARFSTKSRQEGLGLHIVRTIVKKNGGTVVASNRTEGHGARFTLSLPAFVAD